MSFSVLLMLTAEKNCGRTSSRLEDMLSHLYMKWMENSMWSSQQAVETEWERLREIRLLLFRCRMGKNDG
jgi:hypothetical protein